MADRDALTLAQSLCTRLCHDLAGPLGAVGSGAELLQDEGAEADPQIIGLLTDSAASAASRLRFLRALMGVPSGRGLDAEAARAMLADHLAASSSRAVPALTWDVTPPADPGQARALVQLLLNLCLLGLEALPRHERIAVTASADRRASVVLSGRGTPRDEPVAALTAGLSGHGAPLDPRAVQGGYAGLLARVAGLTVTIEAEEGELRMGVAPAA
ncbi:histidine phosphotransferase family protein [Roseospira goensis]|uniref:Histidine phosphotransferase ChpT n=1 Tax=Roseospira goensis TaxID=391922 RepID=A0A7W6WKN9_9PROT|nr:histidine phosphotransferase family protein [Roseospira goensis]MBB4286290.1 histidine phosphotransferase ChpT [Roseospira goensis]